MPEVTGATASRMPADGDETDSVALGDVDGDGDLDMVLGNITWAHGFPTPGRNRLYLNDGTGTYVDVTTRLPLDNDYTHTVELGDVDDDGDLDVVLGNAGQNRLYLNDGVGTFTDVTAMQMPVGNHGASVLLGDVDGDADLDLVGAGYPQDRLDVNLQRQLHAPTAPRIGQTFTLDAYLRYGPPSPLTFALPYVSFAPASIPAPPFGTLGIDPALAAALTPITITQPAGVGSISITVPSQSGLIGIPIFAQALMVPYPFQPRLSNVVHDVVIR